MPASWRCELTKEKTMEQSQYVEHQIHEVSGFSIVDATSTGLRGHDDLIWIGTTDGQGGSWISPESAMALVAAIAQTAHGNMERRRMAAISGNQPSEHSVPQESVEPKLIPLEPLPLDGLPITTLSVLNPVARLVADPAFTMKWLQKVTHVDLTPELEEVAAKLALEFASRGEKLTLMSVIELWRPVAGLRDFAETLYFLASPNPLVPARTKTPRAS